MKIKPMVYKDCSLSTLYRGIYKSYNFLVMSYGTHPCAYVVIPEDNPLYKLSYDEIELKWDIKVHGGLTYSGTGIEVGKWVIGWDYAHFNDYTYFSKDTTFASELKKWTTEEMIEDCKSVIDQLEEIRRYLYENEVN